MNASDVSHETLKNVVLPDDLTISTITDNKTLLMDALNAHEEIRIILRNIEAVDLTGLQLLCSAHRTAVAAGKKLVLSEPLPAPLRQAVRTAGFRRRSGCSFSPETGCLFHAG